ncbi:hypothetical protein GC170_09310 [bacterium]|nr:hypothetical protein [bacterium]
MSGSMQYVQFQLQLAIRMLALGPGDIRSRLLDAYYPLHTIQKEDLPPHLQKDWQWITKQFIRFGPVKDQTGKVWIGVVEHTMRKIRNNTGVKIVERIILLDDELQKWIETAGERG